MKTILQEWEGFAAMVIPGHTADSVQYVEMKKAFFAGALSLLNGVKSVSIEELPDEIGMRYLSEMTEELDSFYRNLIRNYVEGN